MDKVIAEYRLLSRCTEIDNGCWLWDKTTELAPYGRISIEGIPWLAHRLSYYLFRGELLEGLVVDHLCSVQACVNPNHLEQVTQGINVLRAAALITHCPSGHEYTEENTGYFGIKPGKKTPARYCKECNRQKYWKRKEER